MTEAELKDLFRAMGHTHAPDTVQLDFARQAIQHVLAPLASIDPGCQCDACRALYVAYDKVI